MAAITDVSALKRAIEYEEDIPYVWVDIFGYKIAFAIPNEKNMYFADSLKDREPATNEWIKEFLHGDVFFDIGANIGVFSLLAAKVSGCRVIAFEPHFGSYYILMRNIILNGVLNTVTAYPLALSDVASIDVLYVSDLTAGKSLNNFGAARSSSEPIRNAVVPQPAVAETLDGFTQKTGVMPTHIKIDVDGLEGAVIHSAANVLKTKKLRSICVEMNDSHEVENNILAILSDAGFSLVDKEGDNGFFWR